MLRGAGSSADTAAARELWRHDTLESWLFLGGHRRKALLKIGREIRRDVAADSTFFHGTSRARGGHYPRRPDTHPTVLDTLSRRSDLRRAPRPHPTRPQGPTSSKSPRTQRRIHPSPDPSLLLEKVTNRRHELPPQQRRSPAARRQRHRAAPASALAQGLPRDVQEARGRRRGGKGDRQPVQRPLLQTCL